MRRLGIRHAQMPVPQASHYRHRVHRPNLEHHRRYSVDLANKYSMPSLPFSSRPPLCHARAAHDGNPQKPAPAPRPGAAGPRIRCDNYQIHRIPGTHRWLLRSKTNTTSRRCASPAASRAKCSTTSRRSSSRASRRASSTASATSTWSTCRARFPRR
ncbi:protein of unknown function [Burkholderia multivorans]